MMYRFVCVVLMAVAVCADKVTFKDCGKQEVTSLEVTDCSGDACVLHNGKDIVFKVGLTSNQDSQTGKIDIKAKIGDVTVDVPGLDTDACKYTDCPFKKGDNKVINYKLHLNEPQVECDLILTLTGDNGSMGCLSTHVKIEN